jgi:hypothetical protein
MVHLKKKFLHKIFKSKKTVTILKINHLKYLVILLFCSCLKVPSNNNSNDSHAGTSEELTIDHFNAFTTNAFLDLETKVYGDNWSIPYKRKYD